MKLKDRKWERKHVIAAVAGVTLLAAAFFAVFGVQRGAEGQFITIEHSGQEQDKPSDQTAQGKSGQTASSKSAQAAEERDGPTTEGKPGQLKSGSEVETPSRATENKTLMADVDGAVKKPGVVALREGDRVFQALELAGGIREDANTSSVNLARLVEDGEKIYVPTKSESSAPSAASADFTVKQSGSTNASVKININKAGTAELQKLPGIGPSTAEKILEYRRQNGTFHKVEDLKNISGIGEKTFARLREKISV